MRGELKLILEGEGTVERLPDGTPLSYACMSYSQQLPHNGVSRGFPSEQSCINRMRDVRWPHGPRCLRCASQALTWVASRSLFQCADCRHQFSVKADTVLHRSRLYLRTWFIATEMVITSYRSISKIELVTSRHLSQRCGISYEAGWRVRQIILNDIKSGNSLLAAAVCIQRKAN